MSIHGRLGILVVVLGILPLQAEGQTTPAEDAAHDELRALRDDLFNAYEQRDLEGLLGHMHENTVVTWQNGDLNRGREGLRAFYEKMMIGDDRIVEGVESELTVDDLSILYGGDTAVAFGSLDDEFRLMNGTEFTLHSRWTATVVKEGDRWVVASFHVSANMFDNPIVDAAKKLLYKVGGLTGVVGLALGAIAAMVFAKVQKRSA